MHFHCKVTLTSVNIYEKLFTGAEDKKFGADDLSGKDTAKAGETSLQI